MNHYHRGLAVPVDIVVDFILENEKLSILDKRHRHKLHVGEFSAKITSLRMRTFALKGLKCATCERIGSFFAFEIPIKCNNPNTNWHLNLYSVDEDGEEILMTMDHIHPKSKGGKNSLGNVQTMCSICNFRKGNTT